MAISLEQYVAEATNAFKPAQTAVQAQLDAIPGQLQTANETINRNYAQQQSQLNDQRNAAATAASLQAAGSGGSFGGRANLANRRYYTQSFVPAQTQLQTNQSNELQRTRQTYDDKRTSLNAQLSSIEAQANEMALNKYWAAVEAEKQRQWEAEQAEKARQAQRAAAAAQAAAQNDYMRYLMDAQKAAQGNQPTYKNWDFGNGYALQQLPNGEAAYFKNGSAISAGNFLEGTGRNGANWNIWNDVWNNGVSTRGVGSDTVAAFNRMTPTSSKYGYLY